MLHLRPLWPQLRARHRIIPDLGPEIRDQHPRRRVLIRARELDKRPQHTRPALGLDKDLCTPNIELRVVQLVRGVEGQPLGADEILTRRQLGGQGEAEAVGLLGGPDDAVYGVYLGLRGAGGGVGGELVACRVDLGPASGAVVVGRRDVGRDAREVDLLHARVTKRRGDLEAQLGAGLDGQGLRAQRGAGGAARVAAHVGAVDDLEGRVGDVALADVLVGLADHFAFHDEIGVFPVG